MEVLNRIRARLALLRCATVGAAPDACGPIWIHGAGAVRLGERVRLDARAAPIELHALAGAEIAIGDDAVIEGGTSIEARRSVVVGPRARLGAYCKILDSDFHGVANRHAVAASVPVVVDADARVGERCILLPGAYVRAGTSVRDGRVVRGPPRPAEGGADAAPAAGPLARARKRLSLLAAAVRGAVALRGASLAGRVYAYGRVRVSGAGRVRVGDRAVFIGGMIPTSLAAHDGAEIVVGDRCILNYGVAIEARTAVRIGRGCMIASGVRLSDGAAGAAAPITLGDGVWLAHGVVVAPGVTIGDGAVVSAGSVVTRDVPPSSLAAGNPARSMSLALATPPAREDALQPSASRRAPPPHRRLGATEAIFHAWNSSSAYLSGCLAAVDGPLDPELLARALEHVQERHPILGASILELPGGPHFVARGNPPPAIRVPGPAEVADPASLLAEQLHEPYDAPSGPLWRCTFAPASRGGPHHLAIGAHHALADGHSVYRILADIVETCGALHDGRPLPPLLPPQPPLDAFFPRTRVRTRMVRRARNLRARLAPAPLDVIPAHDRADASARRTRVLLRSTSDGVLPRLVARCRAEGTSVEGALTAALLDTLREVSGPVRSVHVSHQISLRTRCRPPISAESIGCFVVGRHTSHPLRAEPEFWETARDATRQLRAIVARGNELAGIRATRRRIAGLGSFVQSNARNATTLGRVSVLGISNRGRVPSVRSGPFVLREYYSATGNHVIGNVFQLSCGSLDGRLMCSLVSVEPLVEPATAESFIQGVLSRLTEASGLRAAGAAPATDGAPVAAPTQGY